ncbi:MAG: M23 family metallopeptidase [Parvibaculum sp.]|nr:M23 family metallopeptidase [Parvibaculum sp.]
MSTFTRAAMGCIAAGGLFLTLSDWRGETGTLIGDAYAGAYAYVAGTTAPPIPLARPPHLALAALGECLRGTGHVDGENAYAAYCTDLASLGAAPAAPPEILAALCMRTAESEGLLSVREGCRMPSPLGGTVLYAEHFKGYLGVVILETARGRVTLAGLAEITVARGARIEKGETLGTAPAATAPAFADAAAEDGPHLLYMRGDATSVPAA